MWTVREPEGFIRNLSGSWKQYILLHQYKDWSKNHHHHKYNIVIVNNNTNICLKHNNTFYLPLICTSQWFGPVRTSPQLLYFGKRPNIKIYLFIFIVGIRLCLFSMNSLLNQDVRSCVCTLNTESLTRFPKVWSTVYFRKHFLISKRLSLL